MELIISGLLIPVEKDGAEEYLTAASRKLGAGSQNSKLIPDFAIQNLPLSGVNPAKAAHRANLSIEKFGLIKILSKSLDTANPEQFYYAVSVVVKTPDNFENKQNFPVYNLQTPPAFKQIILNERPIIIGFGPAGMFAALELIERGVKPLIFERGKNIEGRGADVQRFITERKLNPESNIQFGEGGAGAYSDGKIFSRPNNSVCADKVLKTFIKFGAPKEIEYTAKPHLGTDVLCKIAVNMRNYILQNGGEINYCSKMTDLIISNGKASGVVINGEKEYGAPAIFLAIGHSARDTFEMLSDKDVCLEQKPVSMGVRIEHPAEIINLMRYGPKYKDCPGLGAAVYSLNILNKQTGRGVNTFCMCPGGEVVNASSADGRLVLNGMSYSARQSAFSNAAIVVNCRPGDYGSEHPLAGFEFQETIEKKAFQAGGAGWKAPAQNLEDFLEGKISPDIYENSYKMGTAAADLAGIFPEFIIDELFLAFRAWKKDYPLYISSRAVLLGAETRTSCPVRIRRSEKYESVNIKNLFPVGEGAGYAGGITSSAIDAIKAVERFI